VDLREQYWTALAIGADRVNQQLNIPCDEAIAECDQPFASGFTVNSPSRTNQLRTVALFKRVQAFLNVLEQARVALLRQRLKRLPVFLGPFQTSRQAGHGRIFIPSVI
jgi:hypothetical protein